MRAYEIQGGTGNDGLGGLKRTEREAPKPGPGEVVVRVHVASLNYRDILIARDQYGTNGKRVVPLSDGAGEIAEIGAEVTRFRVGDRVVIAFAPDWINGPFEARYRDTALGGHVDGVLAEYVAVRADALARVPEALTIDQAATLPCAGVTAWNALFEEEHLRPGECVLVQGTGGVSMFALQLARAAGAKVIVTSSSDEKLERARKLGAEHGINYRTSPSWGDDVARLTSGAGVANVIEVGGAGTLAQSIVAARVGGTISLIGVLSGWSGDVNVGAIFRKGLHVNGIDFGSRVMLEALIDAMVACHIEPVIDRVFDFDEAPAAYRHLESGAHFGKIVVRV